LPDAGLNFPSGHGGIAAIVLAAGVARRFGSDKLLHPLNLHGKTQPLIVHSLQPWLKVFGQVSVVVKPGADNFCSEIEKALGSVDSIKIHWVVCADAGQGMAGSLVCGVQANLDASAWVIGLADMPIVAEQAIAGVKNALMAGAMLAAPFNGGRRGHPAGFSRGYRDELLALHGDEGARHILARDRSRIAAIETADAGIFADVDIPGDLQKL